VSAQDRVLAALRLFLDRHAVQTAPLRAARVVGRNPDGTEQLVRVDTTCVTRGAPDNNYTGMVIGVPSVAVIQRSGATGIGSAPTVVSADTLWIDALDPHDWSPGHTYSVTVTGRGFDATTAIDFLEPVAAGLASKINADITITGQTVIDSETLRLEIAVRPGARLYPAGAPIAYGRRFK
jgi:hypothetical protein